MAEIGRINTLKVKRVRDYGAHLDGGESGDILLPKKYVPEKCQPGDEIKVFVDTDGEEHLRATTERPKATIGEFARLAVVSNSPGGAYLDWGLQNDLFVPKKAQLANMEKDKSYVVYVTLDEKTNRVIGSTKLDKFLSQAHPNFVEGEEVSLIIYDKTDLGYKAVVNNSHGGMIYKNEVYQKLTIGQELKGYIKKIRIDRKIDLSLQKPGFDGVDDIAQTILDKIKAQGGSISVTDHSPPEQIYSLFGVSKKSFKKAIGTLYKKKLISIDPKGIKLTG